MKKNPVMFVLAIVLLIFIAAMFIYRNIYLNHLKISPSSGESSIFSYPGPPAFSVDIPNDFQKGNPKADEGQILNGKTTSGVTVTISVHNIPKDISMEDGGPKIYRSRLAKSRGLKTEDIKILSNENFDLPDGTKAWKCVMKWGPRGTAMVTTYLITADKDGKRITIAAHPRRDSPEILEILESLTFKKM
jgi:hypothetical protein